VIKSRTDHSVKTLGVYRGHSVKMPDKEAYSTGPLSAVFSEVKSTDHRSYYKLSTSVRISGR